MAICDPEKRNDWKWQSGLFFVKLKEMKMEDLYAKKILNINGNLINEVEIKTIQGKDGGSDSPGANAHVR